MNCTKLASLTFEGQGVTQIGEGVFRSTKLSSVVIPKSVTQIKQWAFDDCKELTNVSFESGHPGVTIIDEAFTNTALTSITIPANSTYNKEAAFDSGVSVSQSGGVSFG